MAPGEDIDHIILKSKFDLLKNRFIFPGYFHELVKPARLTLGYEFSDYGKQSIFSKFARSRFFTDYIFEKGLMRLCFEQKFLPY